jgi:LAS superfamily LD-carboxypeptidase LdcB
MNTEQTTRTKSEIALLFIGIFLIIIGGLSAVRYGSLKLIDTKLKLNLATAQADLSESKHREADLNDALHNAQSTVTELNTQIETISSTVGTLKKLTETDSELLKKYSKVYFLSENYIPKGLVDIDPQYRFDKAKSLQFLSKALPYLNDLINAGDADGVHLLVASSYRSYATQSGLKSAYKVTYGSGSANSFSADQGYSEHQLGTALDFTTEKIGGGLAGFDKTPEYAWLLANAYKYGFILSYPANNAYYVFEPWHWRFVGVALALRLHEEHENFYNLEQRQLDPYLVNIFN